MTLLSQYNSLFTFQLVMQSLYNGGCHNLSVEAGDVLELMKTLLALILKSSTFHMALLSHYNSLFPFQLVMQSLYNGGCHNLSVEVLEQIKTLLVLLLKTSRFQMTLLSHYNSPFPFQLVMQSLYNGGCHNLSVEAGDVLELMAAANFFQLEQLLHHCQVKCAALVRLQNVVSMYIHAKVRTALIICVHV